MQSVGEFVDVLTAPFKNAVRGKEWQLECEGLIEQARSLLDPSVPSGKELLDTVGGDLPMVVVQYVGVSTECFESSTLLIQCLATAFDPPREMFTAIFEVINMYSKPCTLYACLPFIRGLSILFPRINRRKNEFFKAAISGLLEAGRSTGQAEVDVLHNVSEEINSLENLSYPDRLPLSKGYAEDNIQDKVIRELIHLATVIRGICDADQEMTGLRDTLGVFNLQLLSVASGAINDLSATLPDVIPELMGLLLFCNISFTRLLSSVELDNILDLGLDEEDVIAHANCLEAKRGAALAVFWEIQREQSGGAKEQSDASEHIFQTPGRQMVLAVISLASNLLVPVSCAQEISVTQSGLSLMASILDAYCVLSINEDASLLGDPLELCVQIRPALQRLQELILSTTNPMHRQQAYKVFMKIITQVLPTTERFMTLQGLITSTEHPSLVSLLLTCVKDEVLKAWPPKEVEQKLGQGADIALLDSAHRLEVSNSASPFTSPQVLQLIQCVLRPEDGELVDLPSDLDAVVGALNLYRFLLIRESTGSTNHTQVLTQKELVKGRTHWLLPLREQSLRVQSMLDNSGEDKDDGIQLGMDCMQSVLYRCLEIVEQLLAKSPHYGN